MSIPLNGKNDVVWNCDFDKDPVDFAISNQAAVTKLQWSVDTTYEYINNLLDYIATTTQKVRIKWMRGKVILTNTASYSTALDFSLNLFLVFTNSTWTNNMSNSSYFAEGYLAAIVGNPHHAIHLGRPTQSQVIAYAGTEDDIIAKATVAFNYKVPSLTSKSSNKLSPNQIRRRQQLIDLMTSQEHLPANHGQVALAAVITRNNSTEADQVVLTGNATIGLQFINNPIDLIGGV
jgi:hypothetical protein